MNITSKSIRETSINIALVYAFVAFDKLFIDWEVTSFNEISPKKLLPKYLEKNILL